jgi:hypothetical protein
MRREEGEEAQMKLLRSVQGKVKIKHVSVQEVTKGIYHLFISTDYRYPDFYKGGTFSDEGSTTTLYFEAAEPGDAAELEFEGSFYLFQMPEKEQFHFLAVTRAALESISDDMKVLLDTESVLPSLT